MTTDQWNDLSKKVNMIFVLSDIQESMILEVEKKLKDEGELKFDVKFYINQIKKNARLMVQHVNRHASIHNDNFAHDAEYLTSLIYKELDK